MSCRIKWFDKYFCLFITSVLEELHNKLKNNRFNNI